jgi:hypothetical protein
VRCSSMMMPAGAAVLLCTDTTRTTGTHGASSCCLLFVAVLMCQPQNGSSALQVSGWDAWCADYHRGGIVGTCRESKPGGCQAGSRCYSCVAAIAAEADGICCHV